LIGAAGAAPIARLMPTSPLAVGGAIFLLALGAGLVPTGLRLNPRKLHGVIAAACGLFLGITFLHLLPELAEPDHSARPWIFVLVGLLAVFLADVWLRHEREEPGLQDEDHPAHHGGHRVLGIATFVGLSLHTLAGALAIGLGAPDSQLRKALVAATLVHKSAEAFSLVSVLMLAEMRRRTIVALLVAYALVSPAGIALGAALSGSIPRGALGAADGLAAGTFLYVAVAELLPEVFHGHADRGLKVFLILLGIAASTLAFAGHA
jgi:zinc transporter ZupT